MLNHRRENQVCSSNIMIHGHSLNSGSHKTINVYTFETYDIV